MAVKWSPSAGVVVVDGVVTVGVEVSVDEFELVVVMVVEFEVEDVCVVILLVVVVDCDVVDVLLSLREEKAFVISSDDESVLVEFDCILKSDRFFLPI